MGTIYGLNGPVAPASLGRVLPHEHLPLFGQASDSETFPPSSKHLFRRWYGPVLDELEGTPFRTIVEVTPIGLGRDISFWREVLGGRNVNVILSTGFYIDSRQPEWAKEKSAEEIADVLVREIEVGIGGSDARAGIIKIAPDAASGQSRKVCRAAAIASRRTNARITTHSCNCNRASFEVLVGCGAAPENVYIGHADFAEIEESEWICKRGGNVIFTTWDIDHMIPDKLMYKRFAELVKRGYVRNALMSADFAIMLDSPTKPMTVNWYFYGVENRTLAYIHNTVIPNLKGTYGLSEEDIRMITQDNCVRMLDFRG